jgi:hypothetical protein
MPGRAANAPPRATGSRSTRGLPGPPAWRRRLGRNMGNEPVSRPGRASYRLTGTATQGRAGQALGRLPDTKPIHGPGYQPTCAKRPQPLTPGPPRQRPAAPGRRRSRLRPLPVRRRAPPRSTVFRTARADPSTIADPPRNLCIQRPESFGPNDLGSLASFLRGARRSHRCAVEVRHRAFFEDDLSGDRALSTGRKSAAEPGVNLHMFSDEELLIGGQPWITTMKRPRTTAQPAPSG